MIIFVIVIFDSDVIYLKIARSELFILKSGIHYSVPSGKYRAGTGWYRYRGSYDGIQLVPVPVPTCGAFRQTAML